MSAHIHYSLHQEKFKKRPGHKCKEKCTVGIRVVKAPFFKANLKAVSKRLIKAVKRLLYVVNMMNDCFKMHYTSVHLMVSNRHHDKTIEP